MPDAARSTAGGTLVLKASTALAPKRGGGELAAAVNVIDSLSGLPVVPRHAGMSTNSEDPSGGLPGQLPCALARTTLLSEIASRLNSLHSLFGSVSFEGALTFQRRSLASRAIRLRRPCRLSY
jgi:hypothetical protein